VKKGVEEVKKITYICITIENHLIIKATRQSGVKHHETGKPHFRC